MASSAQLIADALKQDMASNAYKNFLKTNPNLGPLVDAYLKGGARPSDAQLGTNHYAKARVGSEDARRLLLGGASAPAVPDALADYDLVVSIAGSLGADGAADGVFVSEP